MRTVALCTATVFGFLFVCTNVGMAADQIVNIFDLTEGMPTATIDNVPITADMIMADSTDDYLHFQFQSSWTYAIPLQALVSRDLTEPGSTAVSDRLLATLDNSFNGMIDVKFDSRDMIQIPQAGTGFG